MASDSALNLHQGRLRQSKFNGKMARPVLTWIAQCRRGEGVSLPPSTGVDHPLLPGDSYCLSHVSTSTLGCIVAFCKDDNNLRVFLDSCFFLTQYLKLLSCETKTFQELQMLSSATLNCHGPVISSEGALYVILPYDYQAAAAAPTF